jgi:hypothetical protein
MAKGDVRSVASPRGHRSGSYGYTRSYSHRDTTLTASQTVWEWFKSGWDSTSNKKGWMYSIDDEDCYRLVRYSTYRYGLMDILRRFNEDELGTVAYVEYVKNDDSRAKRLIDHEFGSDEFVSWHRYVSGGYKRHSALLDEHQRKEREQYEATWKTEQEERLAKKALLEQGDLNSIQKAVELSTGMIRSDFASAFSLVEAHNQNYGTYIDDAVDAITTGYGMGDEIRSPHGIKLQITVSLDLSNSMYYNHVHVAAANAFREIGTSLEMLKEEYPDDVHIAFFTFSEDDYNRHGKLAGKLESDNKEFGVFYTYRPSQIAQWSQWSHGPFNGEDTYIAPLFEEIEKWERNESDPGAVRLDVIISDAVLEHKTDIAQASEIQERRDGALSSVILNFMPEQEWLNSTMPKRTICYPVHADNIGGMLRQIIAQFVSQYL